MIETPAVQITKHGVPLDDRCPPPSNLLAGVPCYEEGGLTGRAMKYLPTQYRESKRLIAFLCGYLAQMEELQKALCNPCFFDIESATCDCLCIIGDIVGFPCVHCKVLAKLDVCTFNDESIRTECTVSYKTWRVYEDCDDPHIDFTFDTCKPDGEALYRLFLKTFYMTKKSRGLADELVEAANVLFENTNACIVRHGAGEVVLYPGRALTTFEIQLQRLYKSALPRVRGVELKFAQEIV